jgi:hypothetical protein
MAAITMAKVNNAITPTSARHWVTSVCVKIDAGGPGMTKLLYFKCPGKLTSP